VIFPSSDKVTPLLARYSGPPSDEGPGEVEETLVVRLKQLLWDSPKLWELPYRGVVVKCSEDIVAKVVSVNKDYTEYTSMQYLAERAPGIPGPRPHGFIAFGPFRAIFMSYMPDITLAKAWPNLSHEGKLSIQRQLDDIFRRLRKLRQDNGNNVLRGVCGEGVKEFQVYECALFKAITTATEFRDIQFSARNHGSTTYVKLLRSLLQHGTSTLKHELVFTHGDVRTANIMVKRDPDLNGHYVITGIIDWEDSGFYPDYHECTILTRTLNVVDEDDWYLYLPESISPLQFPVRWLIDRLWGIHLRTT
jgi:hypothetical protein